MDTLIVTVVLLILVEWVAQGIERGSNSLDNMPLQLTIWMVVVIPMTDPPTAVARMSGARRGLLRWTLLQLMLRLI